MQFGICLSCCHGTKIKKARNKEEIKKKERKKKNELQQIVLLHNHRLPNILNITVHVVFDATVTREENGVDWNEVNRKQESKINNSIRMHKCSRVSNF